MVGSAAQAGESNVCDREKSLNGLCYISAQMVSLLMQVPVAMDQIRLMGAGDEANDGRDPSTLRIFYKKFSYLSPMEPTQDVLRCSLWGIQVGSFPHLPRLPL
jgi:hypothetical protein